MIHRQSLLSMNHLGFTLIEVLIAVVLLSVGLLGLAGLSATAQKLTYSAYQRSQAASLAYELADAIRANAAHAGDYVGTHNADSCNLNLSHSSGTNVANMDLAEWTNHLGCRFLSAEGTITRNANVIGILLTWNEERARGSDAAPDEDTGEDLRDQFFIEISL